MATALGLPAYGPLSDRNPGKDNDDQEDGVCRYWRKTGYCGNGNRCPYAHPAELASAPNRPATKYASKPCTFFFKYGRCLKGHACDFSHNAADNPGPGLPPAHAGTPTYTAEQLMSDAAHGLLSQDQLIFYLQTLGQMEQLMAYNQMYGQGFQAQPAHPYYAAPPPPPPPYYQEPSQHHHSRDRDRDREPPARSRTAGPCKYFAADGHCRKGEHCDFEHVRDSSGRPMPLPIRENANSTFQEAKAHLPPPTAAPSNFSPGPAPSQAAPAPGTVSSPSDALAIAPRPPTAEAKQQLDWVSRLRAPSGVFVIVDQPIPMRFAEAIRTGPIVCADGGANRLLQFDSTLRPTAIVGDLDSIEAATLEFYRQAGVEVEYKEDQNTDDLQKAIEFVQRQGWTGDIWVLGGLGGNFTQEMGNIGSLVKFESSRILLATDINVVTLLARNTSYEMTFELRPETVQYCGLLPVGSGRASTAGLRWNLLSSQELKFGGLISTSNETNQNYGDAECILRELDQLRGQYPPPTEIQPRLAVQK